MATYGPALGLGAEFLQPGGFFSSAVRRDLADLNRRFLELSLLPEHAGDYRFGWSDPVRAALERADAETLGRMARCPFSLFEVRLPELLEGEGTSGPRVEDAAPSAPPSSTRSDRRGEFVQATFFVAWRLAEAQPFATRLALGLSGADERQFNGLCPSEVALIAAGAGVIRPRWPGHARFWSMLRIAAQADSPWLLQQAHCFGLCLLHAGFSQEPGVDAPTPRHRPPR